MNERNANWMPQFISNTHEATLLIGGKPRHSVIKRIGQSAQRSAAWPTTLADARINSLQNELWMTLSRAYLYEPIMRVRSG